MEQESTIAEQERSSRHSMDMSLSLSVTQDFSHLTTELSEKCCDGVRVSSECEDECVEVYCDVSNTAAECVARETDCSDDANERHHLSDKSLSTEHDQHRVSTDDTDRDELCEVIVADSETQFSETESKKASLQLETSVQHDSCADVAVKMRHKTQASPAQFVRTTSGTFIVHEVTEPGELLPS